MEKSKNEESRKCAHEPCKCLVQGTDEYCSAYCMTADDVDEVELNCDCGHARCALD